MSIDKLIREFENEIKENVNNYNHSVKLWQTAEKAYHLSQEQYRMLIRKFSLGKVSVYELTAAQSDQNNAIQRYYSAIRDTYNSYFTDYKQIKLILKKEFLTLDSHEYELLYTHNENFTSLFYSIRFNYLDFC